MNISFFNVSVHAVTLSFRFIGVLIGVGRGFSYREVKQTREARPRPAPEPPGTNLVVFCC